jgi:tetratricopeptide (TPR) repeat protein
LANRRQRYAASSFVWPALVLLVLAGGAALALWKWQRLSAPPLDRFRRAAASLSTRPVDGRLSGWPHLPPQRAVRSAMSSTPPALMRLRGIAGETLLTSRDPHDVAVARLIAGDTSAAIDAFRGASGKSNDADFWNDYAVACITRSDELDDPTLAIDAVSACDHALAIDTRNAAAHFNRGLALTRLGLLTSAANEWKRAAADDAGSPWAAEALQLAHDVPPNTLDGWTHALPHIAQLDAKQLDALVRAYPQQARTYGEGICMTEWADAVLAGDATGAEQRLTLARRIGDTLRAFSGESLLHDAVIAADDTIRKGTSRTLAEAYTVYRSGRIAHKQQDDVKGEAELRKAEPLFASVNSPMALVTRYYIGSALYAQTHNTESEVLLDALTTQSVERRGYLALAAQIGWERGLCVLVRGSLGDALDILTTSQALFERLGEAQFAATLESFIASTSDYAGAHDKAWRARSRAISMLSRMRDDPHVAGSLSIAARNAAHSREWTRAATLFGLAIDAALRGTNPQVTAILYAKRAIAESETGDSSASERDRAEASRWIRTIPDETMRLQADADAAFANGVAERKSNPGRALEHFRTALGFYERANFRIEMPDIYLECARIEQAESRIADARADIGKGLAILEAERTRLKDADLRSTLFASADDLFATGVDLALAAGDERSAFELSDAQRGRSLLDRFALGFEAAVNSVAAPLALSDIQSALADDAAIVEYSVLPSRVVAFVVRPDALHVRPIGSASDVAASTEPLRGLPKDSDVIPAASAAFNSLLRPLMADLEGVHRVIFVPSSELTDLPYGATFDGDRRQFLIENTLVSQAPSASIAIRASQRAKTLTEGPSLAIAASRFDVDEYPNIKQLPFADREAIAAASAYAAPSVTLLGADATRARILREIPRFRSLHFGGHAIVPSTGNLDAALLVAPERGQRSEIRASELARLNLRQTSTVVLAACRSSSAPAARVSNENLALAFLSAGAASVIATTADLDDEVSFRITPPLHRLMAAGHTPDEALREVLSHEIRDAAGQVRPSTDWTAIRLLGGSADFVRKK